MRIGGVVIIVKARTTEFSRRMCVNYELKAVNKSTDRKVVICLLVVFIVAAMKSGRSRHILDS